MMNDISTIVVNLTYMTIPVLLAITLHEASHGYVANFFGDSTAKRLGRLSLNPLVHIDLFGTVLLPLITYFLAGIIFGYAKPVPVDFRNLQNPKRDMIWVAVAGPAANAALAVTGGALAYTLDWAPPFFQQWFYLNLQYLIFFNCIIGVLNLMPILPLDGGRILAGLLPADLSNALMRLERYGLFIFIGFFFLLPMLLNNLGIPLNPAEILISKPACSMYDVITSSTVLENPFCYEF